MIKNFKQSHIEINTIHRIEFLREDTSGFSFPCDENGNILTDQMLPVAIDNYNYCIAHPEDFTEYNVFRTYKHSFREPAEGDCKCGEHIQLYDQYMGACQCPKCERWYNLFGQELLQPEHWDD